MSATHRSSLIDWPALPAPVRWGLGVAALAALLMVNRLALLEARTAHARDALAARAESTYVPDDRTLRFLSLGYTQAAADLQWLRVLDYFGRHFTTDRDYRWLEHFIDQIIRLDPKFRRIYHWAGTNVLYGRRFTNENVALSTRFYERALVAFPDDSEAAFRIGMNYYIEMKSDDPQARAQFRERGLQYFERAANMPSASPALRRLVAGTANRLGRTELAVQNLMDAMAETEDATLRESLRGRIRALRGADAEAIALSGEAFEQRRRAEFPYVPTPIFLHFASEGSKDVPLADLTQGVVVEAAPEMLEAP